MSLNLIIQWVSVAIILMIVIVVVIRRVSAFRRSMRDPSEGCGCGCSGCSAAKDCTASRSSKKSKNNHR